MFNISIAESFFPDDLPSSYNGNGYRGKFFVGDMVVDDGPGLSKIRRFLSKGIYHQKERTDGGEVLHRDIVWYVRENSGNSRRLLHPKKNVVPGSSGSER